MSPGSRNAKRWQDVDELLDAGIDVISTVNIQHLESINDVVERITGIVQRETIPDEVVRAADQVELVDMTPEALRRRMAHGNVYAPEKVDAALTNYFREGNLAALRELALLWVADQVDVALEDYRTVTASPSLGRPASGSSSRSPVRPATEDLIRRAARIAQRAHGELLGVHVRSRTMAWPDPATELLAAPPPAARGARRHVPRDRRERHRGRAHRLRPRRERHPARPRQRAARAAGTSSRRGSVINRVIRLSGPIDVHVISHEPSPARPRLLPRTAAAARARVRRRAAG